MERSPPKNELPAAIVLAGGLSRRMGGGDKSLTILAGRPLVAHVLERLGPQTGAVAINANGDPSRFSAFGVPVLADTVEGHPGPLAGLLAGMEWAQGFGARRIVSVPTDSPFIPDNLVRLLLDIPESSSPVIASSGGRRHPVVGLWPVDLAGPLRAFLLSGETYRVSTFADRHGARAVEFPLLVQPGRDVDPFFNVNTPDDVAEAEAIVKALQR